MLKTFYLSLFLISCFLLVYYIFLEIKSKNFSLKKNKIIANKNIATAKNNNRKKILLVVALFIAISIILNVVYAIMITLVFAYYIKMNTINKKQRRTTQNHSVPWYRKTAWQEEVRIWPLRGHLNLPFTLRKN